MVRNNSFNDLLAKYNLAIQNSRDLKGQLETRNKELSALTAVANHTEKLTRELCEKILAKNRKEMRLGKEYAWGKMKVDELIKKSKDFFDQYTQQVIESYDKVCDENAKLQNEIDNLNEQLDATLKSGAISYKNKEEVEKAVEREKKRKENEEKLNPKTRQAYERGTVGFIDDDEKLSEDEEELITHTDAINHSVTLKSKGAESANRNQAKKQVTDKTHKIALDPIIKDMNSVQKEILLCIGRDGLSLYKEIEPKLLAKNFKKTPCRMNIKQLVTAQILTDETISIPSAKISVYYLSPLGKRIFGQLFPDEKLVKSQAEEVIAEHDNLTHGYGILHVAEILREKKQIKNVIDKNRKNPISVGSGEYIPDIVCETDNKKKIYIEYEMGTHTQADFNSKLNKMGKVTPVINIVLPNQEVLTDVQKKVERYIEYIKPENLKGITIRLATTASVGKMEFVRQNKEWDAVYKPESKGTSTIT